MTAADRTNPPPCDLCGLDVETDAFVIRTRETTLMFCCEGCEGIYRMLNEVEDDAEPTTARHRAAG